MNTRNHLFYFADFVHSQRAKLANRNLQQRTLPGFHNRFPLLTMPGITSYDSYIHVFGEDTGNRLLIYNLGLGWSPGSYLSQFLLGMCRWYLRTSTPL